MKILIVGDGSAGRRYEKLSNSMGHETIVFGPKSYFESYTGFDGLIIASPPSSHEEYLRFGIKRQWPILCEGPVTFYSPGYPAPNLAASNWRFVRSMQEFVSRIRDGRQIVNAHLWFDWDLDKWRPNANQKPCYYFEGMTNINLHEVDMAMWMFGPAERVHVEARSTLKSQSMDAYSMMIKHSSGVLTTIQSGWHATTYQRGCVVQMRDGSREEISWQSPQGNAEVNESYEKTLDAWLNAIEKWDLSVSPSLYDGYRAWKAMNGEAI